MTDSPFSTTSLDNAVDKITLDATVEKPVGQTPTFGIDLEGSHDGNVDVTWGVWAKTKFTKASTSVGAKFGFKWGKS